jgi:hypothetical protein
MNTTCKQPFLSQRYRNDLLEAVHSGLLKYRDAVRWHRRVTASQQHTMLRLSETSLPKCCNLGLSLNCICISATACPIHGERHIGTHD